MLLAQIISAMAVMLCMLVDSIMIGRFLGVDAMTAYGLANPVLLVFAALGSMMSAGIQVVSGKAMGSGDQDGIDRCFSTAAFLSAVISAVGLILVLTLSSPLSALLGAGRAVEGNAVFFLTKDYLTGFIIGAPAFLGAVIMVPFMQMSGNRSRLVVAIVAMTLFDVLFDLLNVFLFHGGTLGMGIASSLSYYIAFAIGGAYFLKKDCMFRFRLRKIKQRTAIDILKNGVPTMFNQVSLVLLVFLLNKLLLAVGGNLSVASYSIISTVGNICYCFGAGIGSVALMLASVFYSDEDKEALRTVVKTMLRYALLLGVCVIAAVLLSARVLTGLFTDDPAAQKIAAHGLRLFALSLISSALNTSLKNYYQGIGRVTLSKGISVAQSFFFTALYAVILSRFFGTTGVFLGWVFGESTTFLLLSLLVWIKKKGGAQGGYAMLPPSFGSDPESCLNMTVHTVEESVTASEQAESFCLSRGESERNSKLISLSIEEMANNIVTHGFTKDRRTDHSIEIRLIFKEKKRFIRIRDNCVNFDPIRYMELHKADDPTLHIGIRLVMKMVKDASYVCSLGLNNLTLML